jgi:Family of unknown function (DUF6159)
MRASILLFKETFRFFWADKEMLWVPIITLLLQLVIIGVTVVVCVLTGFPPDEESMKVFDSKTALTLLGVLIFYTACAFTVISAQATITHIVYTRIHGGDATLGQGIGVAIKNAPALLLWALITSTVGLLLRLIAERSNLLMKIVVAIIGVAWSVLTYFTVSAMIIDKKPVIEAIKHSGSVFRRTWGETIVTSISFGFAFFLFYGVLILGIVGALAVSGALLGEGGLLIVSIMCGVVFIIAIVGSIILSSVLDSVLRTLLYVYASENITPTNFNSELLEKMLVRKANPVQAAPPVQSIGV